MALTRKSTILTVLTCVFTGGCATGSHQVELTKDVSCIGRATVPLANAIAATEAALHLPVIDAEYDMNWELGCAPNDAGHYDLTLYAHGELRRATVDARTGVVGPGRYESPVFGLDLLSQWPEAEMLSGAPAAMAAPTSIHEAVRLAEADGAKALAAHVKTRGTTTSYVIEIVEAGQSRIVSVDLDTAAVRD